MNISATSGPITTKFYLKDHWVRGKAAYGFGPDRIRTLVSMATESSNRVIIEKTVSPLFLGCFFIRSFSYLQAMMTCMRARTSSQFGLIGPPTAELAALERLKKSPEAYNGKKDVSMFSRLFLIRPFSYLQVMITYMRAWMSLKFSQIQPLVPVATDRVIMEKNGVATFSRLFFIHSFLYLQVMITCMRARKSLNFGLIGPPTAELAALEHLIGLYSQNELSVPIRSFLCPISISPHKQYIFCCFKVCKFNLGLWLDGQVKVKQWKWSIVLPYDVHQQQVPQKTKKNAVPST